MNAARLLGAVIAGGQSRRFGRDKAAEPIFGQPMIEHVARALGEQTERLVVCGRGWERIECIEDRPRAGLGPLGGLNAALYLANCGGYDAVLCVPVDVLPVPRDLYELLGGDEPGVFETQYLIGFWPTFCAKPLDDFLRNGGRAVHDWLDLANARRVVEPVALTNINRPSDLKRKP
ncbi:MAG: molybdenum cofactor guanylyltransferase [Gammaproteobacteria bacterium]|nr:molybdenum cofactor guanylyltransferase [Gammaproteobacteria bacterium]MBU2408151.1 molybdenum cofactor guanylyltransferase [Gammaproteobacteria bacterium]